MNTDCRIRWIGRESVRYEVGELSCEFACFIDPARNSITAVIGDKGVKRGEAYQLSHSDLEQLEQALRGELGVKRFLGFVIGTRKVYVQREQHVS